MSLFQVGEVAVISYSRLPEFPVGMEVTIIRVVAMPGHETMYVIYEERDSVVYGRERCLRKKRPPQDWVKLCKLDEVQPVSVPKEPA